MTRWLVLVWLAPLAVAFSVVAQTGQPRPPDAYKLSDVLIRLERTACFGQCPIYTIAITGNGKVEYEGVRFVQAVGVRTSTIAVDQVVVLLNAFLRARFFDALDEYTGIERLVRNGDELVRQSMRVTDLPSEILTLQLGTQVKRVLLYSNVPAELAQLPDLVDQVAGSERWVRKRE